MIRSIVTALILSLLALGLVAFAIANRQVVGVSLDPFDQANPALVVSPPMYLLVFGVLIGGVVLGGTAAWLGQGRWRTRARRAEAEARSLRAQLSGQAGSAVARADERLRLIVPPPAA